jgi:hypothetical protein
MKQEKKAKVSVAGLPGGVKIVDGQEQRLDAATIRKVMEGWALRQQMEDAKERLDAINAALLEQHGPGCALVVTGLCRASLVERQTVKIDDAQRLQDVLGGRFGDLVRESVTYKAEGKLIEMAADADSPLQPEIASCLSVQTSQSVTWRAER